MESLRLLTSLLLLWQLESASCSMVCGFRPEWNSSHTPITFQTSHHHQLSASTGQFKAETRGAYTILVTAVVGGMLPPKPGDLLMNTSPVYGQIFVRHNGSVLLNERIGFLLVKEGEVGNLQAQVFLNEGDTLSLYAGHVTTLKYSREAYNHRITTLPGGYLEDITFCVMPYTFSDGLL